MPVITINESGFVLDGPLVAGEPGAVSVSGLSLAEGAALSLTCTARFPDALLASVELTQGDGGAWGGVLDTATKQAALYFLTARADEARAVVLELVDTANRDSLARVSAPMLNSSLLPKPDKAEGASPLMIPGPPGDAATVEIGETTTLPAGSDATVTNTGTAQAAVFNFGIPRGEPGGSDVEPSDTTPLMDGTGAAGASEKYARGDHRHPTDTSRAEASDVAAIQAVIPSGATASNKLATASDIPAAQVNADWNATSGVAEILNKPTIPSVPSASTATPAMDGTGAAGSATSYARGDHVHPTDTSRAAVLTPNQRESGGPILSYLTTAEDNDTQFAAEVATSYAVRAAKNLLGIADGTTLSTLTTVYRATATGGVIPTVYTSGIPTDYAYFAFELEIAVPAGATLDASALSSWTWLDGGELPTADYAGKTLYIAARLDCTANVRTVLANCWRVA